MKFTVFKLGQEFKYFEVDDKQITFLFLKSVSSVARSKFPRPRGILFVFPLMKVEAVCFFLSSLPYFAS